MNYRILPLLAFFVLSLFSCESQITGPENLTPQENPGTVEKSGAADFEVVDQLLNDALDLDKQIRSNSEEVLLAAAEWISQQQAAGNEISMKELLVKHLNVAPETFELIQNYGAQEQRLIAEEANAPEGTSTLYVRYMNLEGDATNPWQQREPCAPECCGGWRPLKVWFMVNACIFSSGNPFISPWVCSGAYDTVSNFIKDGCMS